MTSKLTVFFVGYFQYYYFYYSVISNENVKFIAFKTESLKTIVAKTFAGLVNPTDHTEQVAKIITPKQNNMPCARQMK